ncbi:MAG: hypothetical protein J2O38_08180, partial [Acidimicrobiales bacterium]|nr:hypothetical protein [Acidimicrobiales bacterium]
AGYRYAMIPHPLSSLTPEEVSQRAGEILPEVLSILGLGEEAPTGSPPAADVTAADGAGAMSVEDISADEVRDFQRVVEYYYEQGWTDGLPVVPVTAETVADFVTYTGRDPGEELLAVEHLGRSCTVSLAATAAAMAGCRKEHFPVLLSVAGAMADMELALFQSTTGQAVLVIVNGPVRNALGFNGAGNVFGPGFRANATIGRALRLLVMNVFGVRPRSFDQSTQGTPSKYSFCIAENEEESPWDPLHIERGLAAGASAVTTHFARSTLHVENRASNKPEEVLLTIADSMSYAGSAGGRAATVVMGPEHAHLLARHGWSKQAAKEFLFEHWGRRQSDLRRFGLARGDGTGGDPLAGVAEGGGGDEFVRFGDSPESILLVVGGAHSAGLSTVIPAHRPIRHTTAFHTKEIVTPKG